MQQQNLRILIIYRILIYPNMHRVCVKWINIIFIYVCYNYRYSVHIKYFISQSIVINPDEFKLLVRKAKAIQSKDKTNPPIWSHIESHIIYYFMSVSG